jgi:hypothetical protein
VGCRTAAASLCGPVRQPSRLYPYIPQSGTKNLAGGKLWETFSFSCLRRAFDIFQLQTAFVIFFSTNKCYDFKFSAQAGTLSYLSLLIVVKICIHVSNHSGLNRGQKDKRPRGSEARGPKDLLSRRTLRGQAEKNIKLMEGIYMTRKKGL